MSSVSHVEPGPYPQGTHAYVLVPVSAAPRAPLGPSVTCHAGMPTRSIGTVDHRSAQAVRAAFSSTVSDATSAATSLVTEPGSREVPGALADEHRTEDEEQHCHDRRVVGRQP